MERVSINDIAIIWFGSIFVVAPVLYFGGRWIVKGARWIVEKLKAWNFSRNNPLAGDEAAVIIEKLARRKQNFRLAAYTVNGHQVFRLPFGKAQNNNAWVVPPILLTILPAGAAQLGTDVDNLIAAGDTAALLDLLKRNTNRLRVEWRPNASARTTSELPTADLGGSQGVQSLVQR